MSGALPLSLVRGLQRLGLAGLLGLALLGAAAWTRWAWLPQQQVRIDDLGSQARRTRHELLLAQQAQQPGANVISSPEQAWQRLWSGLPASDQRVNLQTLVLREAKSQGLQISAVQYQGGKVSWAAQDGQVLWRQRMEMPVEGSYPALRQWLTRLLAEPALAIDSVDLQRSDVMSNLIKGRVVVSLWWRHPEKTREAAKAGIKTAMKEGAAP